MFSMGGRSSAYLGWKRDKKPARRRQFAVWRMDGDKTWINSSLVRSLEGPTPQAQKLMHPTYLRRAEGGG